MSSPEFYVASPLGDRTAGPEALTQLVDAIRRRGYRAFLVPMRNFRGRRNDPEYDIYDFEVREEIPRNSDARLVISEVSPIESRGELKQVAREHTWMGWFSVNNSPDPRARYFRPDESCCSTFPVGSSPTRPPTRADFGLGKTAAGPFPILREAANRVGGFTHPAAVAVEDLSIHFARRVIDSPIRFFAQSYYAQGFVREVLGRPDPIVITDPVRIVPFPEHRGPRSTNLVLYNKVKSWSLLPAVAELMPDVEFRPIAGKSYTDVLSALSGATAYLELGHLPGRDRMPREAAHVGTPVICLARGAGYCWQDIPLPVDYRVPFREGWPALAAQALRRVLDDPRQAANDQAPYRLWVSGERERYENAVDAWLQLAVS